MGHKHEHEQDHGARAWGMDVGRRCGRGGGRLQCGTFCSIIKNDLSLGSGGCWWLLVVGGSASHVVVMCAASDM